MSDIKISLSADAENPVIGDLYLENGTARLTSTMKETVAQDVKIALSLFKGEWFLDVTQGIPYWQSILGQRTPLAIVAQIFRSAILSRPNIKSLPNFSFSRLASRQVKLTFTATLTDNTVLTSDEFGPFVVGA